MDASRPRKWFDIILRSVGIDMNWTQFRIFLISQLDSFRLSQNSKNFEDVIDLSESVSINSFMEQSHHLVPSNERFSSDLSDRHFNWRGLGEMYGHHLVLQFKDIPVKMGLIGYSSGVHRFTPRSFYQSFRGIPLAMFVGQLPTRLARISGYVDDVSSGKFPGTDESFFI